MALAGHMISGIVAGDEALLETLRGAAPQAARIIEAFEPVAHEIGSQPVNHAFYMGSGPLYGIAREGALKMTEMSITTCSAYPFMEARHGPRSVIEADTLLAGLFGQGARQHEAQVMADFVGTSQPVSVALVPDADWETGDARYVVPVGLRWPDAIQGLAYLPVMHLMAYYRAVAKGVNPDTSRNLSIYVDLTGS
jgi:glucosamine--fructose-6-phosphate aminotransferase (isomerizing)